MLNPDDLLRHANRLTTPPGAGAPRQVDLRRAISAAYYAVFHSLLRFGADWLVGSSHRTTTPYSLTYRAFSHARLRQRCAEAAKPQLPKSLGALKIPSFPRSIRDLSDAFVQLQEERHEADYNPRRRFSLVDARTLVQTAEQAIADFKEAPGNDKKLFIAFLLFGARS